MQDRLGDIMGALVVCGLPGACESEDGVRAR